MHSEIQLLQLNSVTTHYEDLQKWPLQNLSCTFYFNEYNLFFVKTERREFILINTFFDLFCSLTLYYLVYMIGTYSSIYLYTTNHNDK